MAVAALRQATLSNNAVAAAGKASAAGMGGDKSWCWRTSKGVEPDQNPGPGSAVLVWRQRLNVFKMQTRAAAD